MVNRIDLKHIAKVWIKFLKSRLMPTTHTTTVSLDVGKIIGKEIQECATKKQKYTALLFPSLITSIYEASKMKFKGSDERVKNEGVIIARIIERIAVESTIAATLEHPATAKVEQATEIETMLQELSESINAYVQAQKEEN